MAKERLNKGEFYDLVADYDDQALKKVLWTLYWRGTAAVRERIETLLGAAPEQAPEPPPDPDFLLLEVKEFAKLARAGAYLAGDRRVTPKQRTRWRFTFRDLADQCMQLLREDDQESVEAGAQALAILVDLAMDTMGRDYFRSEDPVEAAQFVVSDAARAIWTRTRVVCGTAAFAELASAQMLRWESYYGWTRQGYGRVAEREVSLAQVLSEVLVTPDLWDEFAVKYVEALDGGVKGRRANSRDLAEWHEMLAQRLAGSDKEYLIAKLPGV